MANLPKSQMYYWICRCGAEQAMTLEANNLYRQSSATFYCVHGHDSHYPKGPSEADRLRELLNAERQQRQRAEQKIAEKEDWAKMWEATANDQRERAAKERNRANGYKGHATRITKRAKAGVCPCCNRTFKQLAAHMANKHPQFTPIEIDEGVSLQ